MGRIPRPIVGVHGEDVDLEVPGLLTVRATFLSEGLFDERAGGNPDEEDLYEVEVTHAGDALLESITFNRLLPSSGSRSFEEIDWEEEPAAALPMEGFVMALAWELVNAHTSNWYRICEAARGWDAWTIEDALNRISPEWTPEPLFPDED